MQRFQQKALLKGSFGEVAEWSIAAVLKTVVPRGTRGSNPCLSAINAENQQITKCTPDFTPKNVKLGVFILFKIRFTRISCTFKINDTKAMFRIVIILYLLSTLFFLSLRYIQLYKQIKTYLYYHRLIPLLHYLYVF